MGTYVCHGCGERWRSGSPSKCTCDGSCRGLYKTDLVNDAERGLAYNESHRSPRAEVIEVVRVTFLRGGGANDADPVREVHAYYTKDGAFLCDDDTYPHEPTTRGAL
jgi:hypothetical protein